MTIKEFEIQVALGSLSYDEMIDLADNSKTPQKILTELAKNSDWYVRHRTMDNFNTPKRTLTKLAEDEHLEVRYSVARNPNTPGEVLSKLSKDKYAYVKHCATTNLTQRKVF